MRAGLLAVGSELLRFGRRDSNGDWLSQRLAGLGIDVIRRTLVGDGAAGLADAVAATSAGCDLLIVTGGLGPTADDRTRGAVAAGLRLPLERDPERVDHLKAWFASRGREYRDVQGKQADRPRGADWIDNPLGSAPGFVVQHDGTVVVALPGVPAEMKHMFVHSVVPRLGSGAGHEIARDSLKIVGRTEASVERLVEDLYDVVGVEVTILSGQEGVELHLQAAGFRKEANRKRVADLKAALIERLGTDAYGSADTRLAAVVGALMVERGATLAVAESCTAGLLAATVTEGSGSSAWFRGGVVAYHDELKLECLGVSRALLAAHGAVSAPVARSMAEGAQRRGRATFGIGITGIAGPAGGTAEKPVGRVHLALADDGGTADWSTRMLGDRELIRRRTVTWALDRLRRHLLARSLREGSS